MSEYIRLEDCQMLTWSRACALDYPDMVSKEVPQGPSSFFYALLQAYNRAYISGEIDNKILDRDEFIINFRKDLAEKFKKQVGYGKLQEGPLRPLLKRINCPNVDKIAEDIENPDQPFDIGWVGFICFQLDIDIYILEKETWSVFIYTEEEETYFLRPGHRNVVVLLKDYNGYSTAGIITDEDSIATYFDPTCKFVEVIRSTLHHQRRLIQNHNRKEPTLPPTISIVKDFDRLIQPSMDD